MKAFKRDRSVITLIPAALAVFLLPMALGGCGDDQAGKTYEFEWASISTGGRFTCGVRTDGSAWCWGNNHYGQLGDGVQIHPDVCDTLADPPMDDCSPSPVPVASLFSDVTSISAGSVGHACASKSDGSAWCWGHNLYGQLGDGLTHQTCTPNDIDCSYVPVRVAGLSDVTSVSAGGLHSCALVADGTVWCWGNNTDGQLGDTTTQDRPAPVQVAGLSNVDHLSAGNSHACAVGRDGTAWCWGSNKCGQLGDGVQDHLNTCSSSDCSPTPVQVTGLSGADSISAANWTTCAVKNDSTAWCWGANDCGQLGDGLGHQDCNLPDCSLDERSYAPVQVVSLSDVEAVSAGWRHNCALKSDSTAWCWGANDSGQLGDGTRTMATSPVQVAGLSNAVSISVGTDLTSGTGHTTATGNDATAWGWGDNFFGQLGDGSCSFAGRATPVQVADP